MQPDLSTCRKDCKFYKQTALFELCTNENSQYSIEGKVDFHTINHQRTGVCGASGKDYRRDIGK